jgi:hypothetical protein
MAQGGPVRPRPARSARQSQTGIDQTVEGGAASDRIGGRQTQALFGLVRTARASTLLRCAVLRLTPPQRMAGLVSRPARRFMSMVCFRLGTRKPGLPSTQVRPGWWHTTTTSGWLPCSKPSDTPA